MLGGRTLRSYLRPAKNAALSWLRLAKEVGNLGKGYVSYLLRGKHEEAAYLAMRRLFCLTNGRMNDALAYCHQAAHRPYCVHLRDSLIPGLERGGLEQVVRALDRDGYHVFKQRVPEELCRELTKMALTAPCSAIGEEGTTQARVRFDPERPGGVRLDLAQQDVMENPAAQTLASDPGLLGIAQAYFRAKAVQDLVGMWWSAQSERPNSRAAQLYHFDMDRVKFLKFFLYLTDVNDDNGPHCFIAGSHRRLPKALRENRRFSDEEVFAHYPAERRIEIKGPRGTLVAEDTRGLHKGKPVVRGHRLIFQVEFAINLFGMYYAPIRLNERFTPAFLRAVKQYPYAFKNYVDRDGEGNGSQAPDGIAVGMGM